MPRRRKVLYLEVDLIKRRDAQRAAWRVRKARQRAAMTPADYRAQKAREDKLCADGARIEPHLDKQPDNGCWLWRGGYHEQWGAVLPIVRAGQYGRVHAAVAVWLWWNRKKELPRGARQKRACGNIRCVAPHHALMTNRIVERAKRRSKGGTHGDLREGHEEGQARRAG
jgi:hypothetical protein